MLLRLVLPVLIRSEKGARLHSLDIRMVAQQRSEPHAAQLYKLLCERSHKY